MISAHDQAILHRYVVHFPDHFPRETDPHYPAFNAYRRRISQDPVRWRCEIGVRFNNFSHCTLDKPLEVHHRLIEFAAINGVDLRVVQKDFPLVTDQATLDAFVESDQNFEVLCQFHHRGHAGAHVASHADFTSALYVINFIS